jgi:deoxyribonuclease V
VDRGTRVDFDLSKASQAQLMLSRLVTIEKLSREPRHVIGLDVSYRGDRGFGAAVSINYETGEIEDVRIAEGRVSIPYIPGYLAFREAPLMLRAYLSLKKRDGVIMVNGHGIAHPRGCGIASHIGVVLRMPSIGVARSLLTGSIASEGDREYIIASGKRAGIVYRIGGSRIYVTIGNMVDIEDLLEIVERTTAPEIGLPLPIYWADRISRDMSRGKSGPLDLYMGRR